MNIAKFHFYYAYPFDQGRRQLFFERGESYPSPEDVQQKVNEYRALWEQINEDDKVIKLLIENAGVEFARDLEVFVFGKGMNPMSHPFLVPAFRKDDASYTKDQLIEIFVHEPIHRLVSEKGPGIKEYWDAMRTEYSTEPSVTQNHIIVYALLEVVLTELFGSEKTKEMIAPHTPGYTRAVEIAQERGARTLIDQFRSYCVR